MRWVREEEGRNSAGTTTRAVVVFSPSQPLEWGDLALAGAADFLGKVLLGGRKSERRKVEIRVWVWRQAGRNVAG